MTATLPRALAVQANNIPDDLKEWSHWVCWSFKRAGDSWTKVPINAKTGRAASSTDPATWSTFDQALRVAQHRQLAGVGFVFSPDDPFAGVDLDDCYDPATHQIEPWAHKIIQTLDSYTERSPSGTGVKIIVRGSLPTTGRKRGDVEMYTSGRFFTITGHLLNGGRL